MYLQHLSETALSSTAVEEAVNAIGWVNQISGLEPIAKAPLVRVTLTDLRRKLAKPIVKKEPVTVEMLAALVQRLGSPPSHSELRLLASSLLAFTAFCSTMKWLSSVAVILPSWMQLCACAFCSVRHINTTKVTPCWWHVHIPPSVRCQ